MSVSLWLITSVCVASGPAQMPVSNGQPTMVRTASGQQVVYTQAPVQQVVYTETMPQQQGQTLPPPMEAEPRRGLFSTLGDLFHSSPSRRTMTTMPSNQVIYASPMPMQGQVIASSGPQVMNGGIVQVSAQQMVQAPGQPSEVKVRKEFQHKVGHADDFSWVTGQLFFMASDNLWAVRYTSPDEPDSFGGCAVLAPGLDLNGSHDGDLVSVNGQVVPNVTGSRTFTSCFYKATTITPLERVAAPAVKPAH